MLFAARNGSLPRKAVVLRAGPQVAAALATTLAAVLAGVPAAAHAASPRTVPAVSGAAPAAGPLGRAIEVPGLGALNSGGGARVTSLSCTSAGNCAAGGHYTDRHHNQQVFVADERHGRWGQAIEVPGLGALNKGGGADVLSVSCASAGNCAAGGYYSWDPGIPYFRVNAFVVTEREGRWGKAVALPAGDGEANSVSCAPAGTCLAGGNAAGCYCYIGNAFVVQERAGRWGSFKSIPGLRVLEHGGAPDTAGSWINSVACPSSGNCAVGGAYIDASGGQHAFVADKRNGAWGTAIEVPGLAALNTDEVAVVNSVACGSAGNCAADGYYTDGSGQAQEFVAVEQNGAWGTATGLPGLAALSTGGGAEVNSVSCDSAGSCLVGGYYTDSSHHHQGFVAGEDNGVWGTAIQVPGLAALNKGGRNTQVRTVSCAPSGSCVVGGFYSDGSHHRQGFVASEDNGVWGTAIRVPGLAALNAGGSAEVGSLSCRSPGGCATGGYYTDGSGHHQGFVTQAR